MSVESISGDSSRVFVGFSNDTELGMSWTQFNDLRAYFGAASVFTPEQTPPSMADELAYLHDRIDQLIWQSALEVGLLQPKDERPVHLARERFWAADDEVAENHGRPKRQR